MKIPEKKIETYNNPEHSDRDIQKQLEELEETVYNSLGMQKEDYANIDFKEMLNKAMKTLEPKRVIGKYMGKDVYEGDITFDPEKNVYVIDLKDGSVAEVDPKHFSYAMDYDKWRKEYGGTRVADAKAIYGVASGSQHVDPLRARVEAGSYVMPPVGRAAKLKANGVYGASAFDPEKAAVRVSLGSAQAHASAPWDDPLKDMRDKADNTVACCDLPEPNDNSDSKIKVYYHDRYPSIPVKAIIDDAIELLNEKKNLHITKITFHTEKFGDQEISLAFTADHPADPSLRKVLEVIFTQKAFDRAYDTEIDKYARLKARLDTNTYMKLRIAFLLYQALKLNDSDAKKISLDIFRIFSSNTRPNFHI